MDLLSAMLGASCRDIRQAIGDYPSWLTALRDATSTKIAGSVMLKDTETRLALQAARGINALQALERIKTLMRDAETARDEARVKYSLSLDHINEALADSVAREVNGYQDTINGLSLDDDYYQDDDDK